MSARRNGAAASGSMRRPSRASAAAGESRRTRALHDARVHLGVEDGRRKRPIVPCSRRLLVARVARRPAARRRSARRRPANSSSSPLSYFSPASAAAARASASAGRRLKASARAPARRVRSSTSPSADARAGPAAHSGAHARKSRATKSRPGSPAAGPSGAAVSASARSALSERARRAPGTDSSAAGARRDGSGRLLGFLAVAVLLLGSRTLAERGVDGVRAAALQRLLERALVGGPRRAARP